MRCISLDFPEGDLINPAYAYKINVGYILSDYLDIIGSTVLLLLLERKFKKMSLRDKADTVAKFQTKEPEAMKMFDEFFAQQKQKNNMKHLPNNLFLIIKKNELVIEKIVNNWMTRVQTMLRDDGFFSFYNCFDKGIFENHYLVDTKEQVKGSSLLVEDLFSNTAPIDMVDKTIWLLAEGFYNETIFEDGAVMDIDLAEEGKPYLIKCLDLPNLNTLTSHEMGNLKDQIHEHITVFKSETEVWATKCYTEKGGMHYFRENVMPTMQLVQFAVENDSVLKQWDNLDIVKKTSSVYFGEVTPPMIWKYYKNDLMIKTWLYEKLMADYILTEGYTIPVMVFAYNKDVLKLVVEPVYDGATIAAVHSVKKHFEV